TYPAESWRIPIRLFSSTRDPPSPNGFRFPLARPSRARPSTSRYTFRSYFLEIHADVLALEQPRAARVFRQSERWQPPHAKNCRQNAEPTSKRTARLRAT